MKNLNLLLMLVLLSTAFTAHAAPPAPVPSTGQTICYDTAGTIIPCVGTGQDADIKSGVAWPNPRFTDNSNGTVTDTLTGLIWLRNANCFGTQTWTAALSSANVLASGQCGLTDGSTSGQWRLPSIRELGGLVDRSRGNPALPAGHPFTSVQSDNYWSGSTYATYTSYAWYVNVGDGGMDGGYVYYGNLDGSYKTNFYYVWPVRSGQ